MRAFWQPLTRVPGQLRKVPKPTTQKGAKMPKNQILVVAQLARLPCAPTKPLGSPNARKQCLNVVRSILFQLAQGDYFPHISLLLVFSPCGLTAMMPAQRLRPYPAQLRLMAIKDGLSHRCTLLFHLTASHQIKTKTGFPNFLISLFPFFLCGHYFLAVYAQSFKHQQQ